MLGAFFVYHIISVVVGGAAIAAVLILYLKSKNPKLPPLLVANLLLFLFVAALSYKLYCDLLGLKILARNVVHESEQFIFRRRRYSSPSMRHYDLALTILRGLTLALFPGLFVVDFFSWMIPALASRIPEDLSLLSAFYLLMSFIMLVGSIKEILEPEPVAEGVELDENLLRVYDLSRREAEVLPLVLQFLSYKEIGEQLFISVGTVRTHLIHIYQKTGAHNRLELLRIIHPGMSSAKDMTILTRR